jgi:hypothetical protein
MLIYFRSGPYASAVGRGFALTEGLATSTKMVYHIAMPKLSSPEIVDRISEFLRPLVRSDERPSAEIARKLGCHDTHIYMWLAGVRRFSYKRLVMLAEILGCEIKIEINVE